jgi:hypothetical protein
MMLGDQFRPERARYLELGQATQMDAFQKLSATQQGFTTGSMGCCSCLIVKSEGANPVTYGQHAGGGLAAVNYEDILNKLRQDTNTGRISVTVIPGANNFTDYSAGTRRPEDPAHLGDLISSEQTNAEHFMEQLQGLNRETELQVSSAAISGSAVYDRSGDVSPGLPDGKYVIHNRVGSEVGRSQSKKGPGCIIS